MYLCRRVCNPFVLCRLNSFKESTFRLLFVSADALICAKLSSTLKFVKTKLGKSKAVLDVTC